MIVYGSIDLGVTRLSDWLAPSTIATLIGGLGGALAGTWLSGINANKLWNQQEKLNSKTKADSYNVIIKNMMMPILFKESQELLENFREFPNINLIDDYKGGTKLGYSEEDKEKIFKVYKQVEEDVGSIFNEMEEVYYQSLDMVKLGIVDWETFKMLNIHKLSIRYFKDLERINKKINESHLDYRQLKLVIKDEDFSAEKREHAIEVLNAYDDKAAIEEVLISSARNLYSFWDFVKAREVK